MKKRLLAGFLVLSLWLFPLPVLATQTAETEKGSSASESSEKASSDSAASAAAAKTKLSEAEAEMKELEQQLSSAKELIASLESNKSDIEGKVWELDTQLSAISAQIDELTEQLDQKNQEIEEAEGAIADTAEKLSQAEARAAEQYDAMKLRMQFMYENTTAGSLFTSLLKSGSITKLLSAVEYINQLAKYDRDMLTSYEETAREIASYEEELETEKTALEADRAELDELKRLSEDQKATIASLEGAKRTELMQVNTYIDAAENTAEAYEDEIAAQNEVIAEIRAEIAREEAKRQAAAAAGETYEERSYDGGVFLWPCPASHRVTSDFGYRTSPTAGASTYHKGIDIGAPYGSAIIAAAPGEVTFAGYSSGAGNYVIVNHGSGLRTVYMHASSLNVSLGQVVAAGDTVAYVGSTGISTGNHLHFGVSLNGEYVSPWSYLG